MADEKATVTREHREAALRIAKDALGAHSSDDALPERIEEWLDNLTGSPIDVSATVWLGTLSEALAAAYAAGQQSQASRDGWAKATALPSWLTGWYWLQYDDGSVGERPAFRNNGAWWYGDMSKSNREHAPVMAFCRAVPPPPAPQQEGE